VCISDGVLAKYQVEDANIDIIDEKISQNEEYNSLYSAYDCQRVYEKLDNETAKLHICGGVKSEITEVGVFSHFT
jgi:hypothetical protein